MCHRWENGGSERLGHWCVVTQQGSKELTTPRPLIFSTALCYFLKACIVVSHLCRSPDSSPFTFLGSPKQSFPKTQAAPVSPCLLCIAEVYGSGGGGMGQCKCGYGQRRAMVYFGLCLSSASVSPSANWGDSWPWKDAMRTARLLCSYKGYCPS